MGLTITDPAASLTSIGYLYSYTVGQASSNVPVVNAVPGGTFTMGDEFNTIDPNHPSDETPLHTVTLNSFDIGKFDITDEQYCDFLNSALSQGIVQVVSGLVYGAGSTYGVGSDLYAETRQGELALYGSATPPLTTPYSGISWNGSQFAVLAGDQNMPVVGVYWDGATAYCNWLSTTVGLPTCYTYNYNSSTSTSTWTCNLTAGGYRLPTEAEWEYAADGGNTNPYDMYPWGDDPNTNGAYANTLGSGSPYAEYTSVNQAGAVYPWTTPVGFYDGAVQQRGVFGWPGSQSTYQTANAENGYGLYDMSGDVWQWTNDWYAASYYATCYAAGTVSNPAGPATGDTFGTPASEYHTLRGGSYAQDASDAAIANRDPAFYRQPLNTTYASIGFRIVLSAASPVEPGSSLTALAGNLKSSGGAASDSSGNVYFSDPTANTIYEWSTAGKLLTFMTGDGGAAGLRVDARGNVIACQDANAEVVAISTQGTTTVLASQYNDLGFNDPYDLWIDPQGGIYMTDPVTTNSQPQAVYYISPDRLTVSSVISSLSKPTAVIGNGAGTTLYVSDAGAGVTYEYSLSEGTATGQTVFAAVAATAMDIDSEGNVYLATANGVEIYSSAGTLLATISTPSQPVALCFGGNKKRTLCITTNSGLYSIGVTVPGVTINGTPTIAGTTRTIINPQSTDVPWVTSNVTDDGTLASVQLSYTTGGTGLPTTEFTETMASTPTANGSAWNGTGANNAWTITEPNGKAYLTQQTAANYGSGNVCGLQFKGGDTALSDTMVTTASGIDTAGAAATVQFYLACNSASTSEGWAFQVNAGNGWVTCASESDDKHSWQVYNETLTGSELASSLLMRFEFEGNGSSDVVDLDDITVATTFGTTAVIPMVDDGQHNDGVAGDSVYGPRSPPSPAGPWSVTT